MERVSVSESSMRSRYSRMPETVANQDGIFEPTTWRESDHNTVQRSRVRCTGTPWLRDKEDTLPPSHLNRVERGNPRCGLLLAWIYLATVSRRGSQSSVRMTQFRSGKRMTQEANAARRKAQGNHNLAARATHVERPTPKGG